jgi:RNA polymerase sigma-70 factor (ECF subfamily)
LTKPIASFSEPVVDETILVSSAQRDPAEFAALYDRFFRPIYHYLYSRVASAVEAEDLTAQTFLTALEALPRYRHRGHFAAWLFTIARNKARDFYRNGDPLTQLDENHPDESDDPLSQAIRTDQIKQLAELVSTLEENEQELIRLRFVADLSFAEIGVCLGRKEDTVKKTFYRLLARLQRQLEVSHD